MSNAAITVENIGKRYKLGGPGMGYFTLRDALSWRAGYLLNRLRGKLQHREVPPPFPPKPEFWALRNVSFEVKHGEVVGIIGRNGAGKSTLLKLLSRITEPTEGCARIRGRIGSLLEVGTGFHPELSGRENIYLNGAILGMRKAEIDRKFDEIVAFSEIEQFLDTPVKRYSSGMYVRLAFAVAAHLEPEILLVDEVLAVGDAAFQKKCLGKMGEVAKGGRTILFVSHNMQAIRQLCQRAILFENGTLASEGTAIEVCDQYLKRLSGGDSPLSLDARISELPPDPSFQFEKITLTQLREPVLQNVSNGDPLEITLQYRVLQPAVGMRVFFDIRDTEGTILFRTFHDEGGDGIPRMEPGRYISRAVIPANLLSPQTYDLVIASTIFNVRMCVPGDGIHIPLDVERTGLANRAYLGEPIRGKLAPIIPWETTELLAGEAGIAEVLP